MKASEKVALLFSENNNITEVKISVEKGDINNTVNISKNRIEAEFTNVNVNIGSGASIVTVRWNGGGFSFFLRDINKSYPVYIPEYGAAITEAEDLRSYEELAYDIEKSGKFSAVEQTENAEEVTFEKCAAENRIMKAPTWLGITRDIRIFEVGIQDSKTDTWDTLSKNVEGWNSVTPRLFGNFLPNEELPTKQLKYVFLTGRGIGCENNVKRELEEGYLPILRHCNCDNGIKYTLTFFASTEDIPLVKENIRGTEMYAADANGIGFNFTEEQKIKAEASLKREKERENKSGVVLYLRINCKNTSSSPKYAFVHLPDPLMFRTNAKNKSSVAAFDGSSGLGLMPSGDVYLSAKCDKKMPLQNEMSILLFPNGEINIDCIIPHTPVSRKRGEKLLLCDFNKAFSECKSFWKEKLSEYAKIDIPEKRINNMLKAGLLHLETVLYGCEPDGAIVPAVGKYTAIGSESSPVIQTIDFFGNSKTAERAIEYFVEKQHKDGFIQNYLGYMLETGYVLWTMGEHYRLSGDDEWAERIADNVIAACEYNINWISENKSEDIIGKGYGMISGKTCDTDIIYHSYMLNSGMYAGFTAASEILKKVNPEYSEKYEKTAGECKNNIMASLKESLISAPVIPLQNGKWVPSFAPYTESRGAASLYADKEDIFSHGTFLVREMTGADYLPLHGVFEPDSIYGHFMEEFWAEFLCCKNVGFSQPYYSPHPYINLKRGNVKTFLSEFYNNMSALADRETYTFWEHFFEASVHKTHEEAWFLMRLRWLLWLEDGDILRILPGAPRSWLEEGNKISAKGVKTYFGELSFEVNSKSSLNNKASIDITLNLVPKSDKMPKYIYIRIASPYGNNIKFISGGKYNKETETVIIETKKTQKKYCAEISFGK